MKTTSIFFAAIFAMSAMTVPASAGGRNNNDATIAAAVGFGLGVIVGTALRQQQLQQRYYVCPHGTVLARGPYGPVCVSAQYQRYQSPPRHVIGGNFRQRDCRIVFDTQCIATRTSSCAGYRIVQRKICR